MTNFMMFNFGKSTPFEEDIEKATNENNLTEDWSLIMHICDVATNYQDGAKICFKAILKRLHHNVPVVALHTLTLLDACVKNCDRKFLLQVASSEFTTEVRKLLGKMHPSTAIKLKELLQKWSLEEFKDDPELGIIPSLYYKLKSEGVEFPPVEKEKKPAAPICTDPNVVTSQEEENDIIKALEISMKDTGRYSQSTDYGNSSIGQGTETQKLSEPFKVRTLYDFDAAEDNELTIKTNEIVLVLDNSNSSWWKGSNHRGEGLFPANFVTEDLDFHPEDIAVAIAASVSSSETVPDTSFTGEVKLNEEKIETVINWLNDTDPAGETTDPEDMLRLEDEVCKMGPLIEEQMQSIDKRLAMLNLVNERIMAAFETFHDLSDHYTTLPSNMKFGTEHYAPGTIPNAQVQAPTSTSTTYMNRPSLPIQQVMYVPAPIPGAHSITGAQPNVKPPGAALMQGPNPIQMPMPGVVTQILSAEGNIADQVISDSTTVSSSAGQTHPLPVMTNLYNPNAVGGLYIPQGVPFPYQYPPNPSNIPTQVYMQPPGTPNFMNLPYAVPPMGPYMPLPYYYVNSTASAAQPGVPSQPSSQNPVLESSKMPSTTVVSAEVSTASPLPTYSSDLQIMTYSDLSASSGEQTTTTEPSQDSNSQVSGDTYSQTKMVPTTM